MRNSIIEVIGGAVFGCLLAYALVWGLSQEDCFTDACLCVDDCLDTAETKPLNKEVTR